MIIKPNPSDLEDYTAMLESNKRIELYEKKYFIRINILTLGLLISGLCIISVMFYEKKIDLQLSAILGGAGLLVFFLMSRYANRVRSASIIGESLIMNTSGKKSYITTLNTIQKVTTYHILSVQCTFLNYTLDGRNHKTILLGNPPGMAVNLDRFILHAKLWSKNKRQTISRVL